MKYFHLRTQENMNISTINYKKVKCPKCGKAYFKIRKNYENNIFPLVFKTNPDPIYKDGELQNPTEAEPIKEYCTCMECGCNFRVETYDVFGDYKIVDEDVEREENLKRIFGGKQKCNEEEKKPIECLTLNEGCIIEPTGLFMIKEEMDVSPITTKSDYNDIYDILNNLSDRLDKLEKK